MELILETKNQGRIAFKDHLFGESLRRFVAPILMVGATLPSIGHSSEKNGAKAEQTQSESNNKSDKEKLKKVHENLDKLSKGLEVIKWATLLASVKNPTAELKAVSKITDKLSSASSNLNKGIGEVLELVEDEENEKAKDAVEELAKDAKIISSNEDKLNALKKKIDDIEVGLISEKSDEKFEVTLELLVDDPEEALKRLVAMGDAMEQNIDVLEKRQEGLEQVIETSDTVAHALIELEDGLATMAKYAPPIFNQMLALNSLDAYNLSRECSDVQSTAEAKLIDVKRVLKAEKARLENLDTNLETFWGKTR